MCLSRKVVDQTCRVCHVLQWPCEQKNSLGPTSFFPEMLSNHLAMLWNMSAIHTHFSNNLSKKVLKFSSQISTIYSMHTVTSITPSLSSSLPPSLPHSHYSTNRSWGSHTHVHHMSQEVHRLIHVRTTAELYKSRHRVKVHWSVDKRSLPRELHDLFKDKSSTYIHHINNPRVYQVSHVLQWPCEQMSSFKRRVSHSQTTLY